ncbi:hypothetical protein, partial [uncultured Porphyromonas sp.]|uniref:hypothetical protein n=1 Tax=uncultured Porphyromonas sp. TaxID=159274 RepID=UPI0026083EE7
TSEESNHKSEEFTISSGANQKYPPSYLGISREELEQAHFYMRQPWEKSNDMSEEMFPPHMKIGKFLHWYSLFSQFVLPNSPTIRRRIKE